MTSPSNELDETPDELRNGDDVPAYATKVVIAGSRTAADTFTEDGLQHFITSVMNMLPVDPDVIVSGDAKGVDQAGETWARDNDLPVAVFIPDWDDIDKPDAVVRQGQYGPYNAKAGHDRNERMALYADALIAVWDGESSGTRSMIDLGLEHFGEDRVSVGVFEHDNLTDDVVEELGPILVDLPA